MDKLYIVPIITFCVLVGFAGFVMLSDSGLDSNQSTLSFNGGDSEYQIVNVGNYEFKIPNDLKLADEKRNGDYQDKFFSINGVNSVEAKGVFLIVWKNYPLNSNEFVKKEYSKAYNIQQITISGHEATKFYLHGDTMYSIRVNNDIITIGVFKYSNELNLVETILELIFSDSNNKFGGGESSDSSSDDSNSTDDSNTKTNNNKNSGEKIPPKEPKPPSDDLVGSGGTGNNNNNNNGIG